MTTERRKHRAPIATALCGAALLLLAAPSPALALEFFGAGKAAVEDDVRPAHPNALQQPSEPLPGQDVNALGQPTYGADVSFPIHHTSLSENYAWLPHNVDPAHHPTPPEFAHSNVQYLGNKQAEYDAFVKGCEEHYGHGRGYSACKITEADRVEMSLRQPSSMQNYTELGFKKIRAPKEVWERVKAFWEDNKDEKNWKPENWPKGNTYTNHWDSPTYMVSVEDTRLRGAGSNIKRKVWNAAKDTMQQWISHEVTECSLYGIRVYTEGAILATHVDRMPLVSSAIINVAQDVDEPWPIEVYGHDGKAYNITMEPGDMVLYESHSVLHGRPFPLKGRLYANIFVHFEPTGHSLRHEAHEAAAEAAQGARDMTGVSGGHEGEASDGLPSYIVRGSKEEDRWFRSHPNKPRKQRKDTPRDAGSTPAHSAAQEGNAKLLKAAIDAAEELLDAKDNNGWTPLHEGARGGHEDVVQLLVDRGAKINEREGSGGTPLYWSIKTNGADDPVSMLLASLGGLSYGPDL